MGTVRGSAVTLCSILGIPFVRFRAAVPEEWFSGSVAQTVGRKRGLSAQGVQEYKFQIRERWEGLLGNVGGGCFGPKKDLKRKIPELELEGARADNLRRLAQTRSMRTSVGGGGGRSGRASHRRSVEESEGRLSSLGRVSEGPESEWGGREKARHPAGPPSQGPARPVSSHDASIACNAASAVLPPESVPETGSKRPWRIQSKSAPNPTQNLDEANVPDVTVETLVGTALMFAFVAASRLLPMRELGERQRAAAYHFGDEAGTFLDLEGKFAAMLDEATLMDNESWLKKARMWRFIFLQEREGCFEPTASLAWAMFALRPKHIPKMKVFTGIMKYIMKARDMRHVM